MKNKFSTRAFAAGVGLMALTLSAMSVGAANAENTAATPATATLQSAPPLSSGAQEALKLSQSKVGDDAIVSFVHNSGRNYGLTAAEIIYLHEQGVSDRVITAMINQIPGGTQSPVQSSA